MTFNNEDLYNMFEEPYPEELTTARNLALQEIEKREKRHRISKLFTQSLWIYLTILSTIFLVIGGMHHNTPKGTYFTALACFWLLTGGIQLARLWFDHQKLELDRLGKLHTLELRALRAEIAAQHHQT